MAGYLHLVKDLNLFLNDLLERYQNKNDTTTCVVVFYSYCHKHIIYYEWLIAKILKSGIVASVSVNVGHIPADSLYWYKLLAEEKIKWIWKKSVEVKTLCFLLSLNLWTFWNTHSFFFDIHPRKRKKVDVRYKNYWKNVFYIFKGIYTHMYIIFFQYLPNVSKTLAICVDRTDYSSFKNILSSFLLFHHLLRSNSAISHFSLKH